MIRAVKQHPGVFVGGMITYALITHVLIPKYGHMAPKGKSSS